MSASLRPPIGEIANRACEAGISINAFVKKALDEAVKTPAHAGVAGYGIHAPEPAMLMDSNGPFYGSRTTVELRIPTKDQAFLQELARRMGWERCAPSL